MRARLGMLIAATLLLVVTSGTPIPSGPIGPLGPRSVAAAAVQTGKIVYTINSSEIWVAERDGSNPHHVADGNNPVFSPDGLRIAFSAQDDIQVNTFIYSVPVDGGGRVRESGPFADPPPPPVDANGPYDLYSHSFPRYSPDGQGIFYFGMEQHYDTDGNCGKDAEGFARSSGDGGDTWLKTFWTSCEAHPDDLCFPSGVSAQDFSLGGPWPAPTSTAGGIAYDMNCPSDPNTPVTAQLLGRGASTPMLPGAEIAGGWTPDGRILLARNDGDGIHDYLVSPSGQATRLGLPNPLFATATTGCRTEVGPEPLGVVFSPDARILGWSQGAEPSADAPSPACTDRHAGIWLVGVNGSSPRQVIEGETAVLHDIQCTPGNCLTGIIITKDFGGFGTLADGFPVTFRYSGAITESRQWHADPFNPPWTDPLLARLTPGTYTITETDPSGWSASGVRCTDVSFKQLAPNSVSITIAADAGIGTCTFTSDWDGATKPTETEPGPPATGAPSADPACPNRQTYHGDWAAMAGGKDTLDFQVTFEWCHGPGVVKVVGPVEIKQHVGDFWIPGWLTYFSFAAHDDEISYDMTRPSDSTAAIRAQGSFTWCTSILQIASEVLPEFKVLRGLTGARFMNSWMKKQILLRVMHPLTTWIRAALVFYERNARLLRPDVQDAFAELFFKEEVRVIDEVLNEFVGVMLGYVPNGNGPALTLLAPALVNFCAVETWHPDLTITLHDDGATDAVFADDQAISPIWSIDQIEAP
ncbi:MAG TPA: hypothetical protein VJ850_12635 [Candidatus Limnocylindrales bacterium]|nr:hypothetical protein [Candidatus Limnocylindrales bacterium]